MSKRNMSKDSNSKAKMSFHDMPGHDISEEGFGERTGGGFICRLKSCNIFFLRLSVAVLIIFCGVLLGRIHSLNRRIEDLTARMERLSAIAVEQQQLLEQIAGKRSSSGSGTVEGGKADTPGAGQANAPEDGQEAVPSGGQAVNTADEITAAHRVYLTFDDGPSSNTQEILDILDRYGVKATFFVVGKEGDSAEESMRRIVEDGHTIGMHSYTHKYSDVYASVEAFADDFAKLQEYIYDVTGVTSTVYRFPGGSSNTLSAIDMKEFAQYLDSQGVRFFDWNISSTDGASYLVPAETLIENCTSDIDKFGTAIILMHDAAGKKTTVEALPEIIEKIQAMEDTVILPITDETTPVQHIRWRE